MWESLSLSSSPPLLFFISLFCLFCCISLYLLVLCLAFSSFLFPLTFFPFLCLFPSFFVLSTDFDSFLFSGTRNCNEGGCGRCSNAGVSGGEALDACLCLHAEENALLEAGRERGQGGQIFCTTFPCVGCAKKIVQMGIERVVYSHAYAPTDAIAANLLRQCSIAVEQFSLPSGSVPQVGEEKEALALSIDSTIQLLNMSF